MLHTTYNVLDLIVYTIMHKRGFHWFLWDLCDLAALDEGMLFKSANYLLNKIYADTYWNAKA